MHYYLSSLLLFRIHLLLLLLVLLVLLLLFIILYCSPISKKKMEKYCTTYDVEVVFLTRERQVCLIEPKYEQQVSRP